MAGEPDSVVLTAERAVLKQIREGGADRSGRLASERTLARSVGVSRNTLRKALRLLEERGVVTSTPQSGWFIAHAPLGEPARTLISFTEMAHRRGAIPHTVVISRRVREASLDEARLLGCRSSDAMLYVERVRYLNRTAVCLDRSLILLERVPGLECVDLTDRSLYKEMASLDAAPSRSDVALEAVAANERLAGLLEIDIGAPVLEIVETCFDQFGLPLLLGRSSYGPNTYRFHATLQRR